ncbi:mediator of RNA polymerase II transcription subunit 30 [Phlebotomus papatasi]|uniref:Mediator of RNA polymerase II transcription subunit 30 n=1 Tax=Phlebotomus papatasi TaxID=29031 RepID=A0A1B0GNQ0_PHLPP|nr:mediator of RNA polymerase II transcription subunit 30 [Phlebotomus papatasi]
MSNQYPGGFGNQNRGNFGNQMVPMSMAGGVTQGGGANGTSNQMGNMMNYNQGMMHSPQQQQIPNTTAVGMGGVAASPSPMSMQAGPGMQSPSHVSQQQTGQQQQTSMQQQQVTSQQQQSQNSLTLHTSTNSTAASGGTTSSTMMNQGSAPGQGQFNIVSLCKFGQETVQDIVSRFQEVFQALRVSTPPNGTTAGSTEKKVQEQFRTIRLLFKRVRILYDKCNDSCQQGMEYTHVESLIPLKDEHDHKPQVTQSEEYQKALQDNRELLEQVMLKNKQLREVIDRIRIIIWEINTMLSMRKS